MSLGGGGSAGAETPSYLRNAHEQFLTGSGDYSDYLPHGLMEHMETIIEDNESPYYGESPYDPADDLDSLQEKIESFETDIDAIDPESKFESFSSKAKTVGDSEFPASSDFVSTLENAMTYIISAAATAMADSAISNAVDAYETRVDARAADSVSKMAAGMADINAVHSSAFANAEALILAEADREVERYEKELKLKVFGDVVAAGTRSHLEIVVRKQLARDSFVLSGVDLMMKTFLAKIQAEGNLTQLYDKYYIESIVANREYTRESLEMDVNDALWDINVFQAGANVIAAASGAVVTTGHEMTPTQSALSGMLGGAAMAAMLPGIGWAGIAAGAGVGLLYGLFGDKL